MRVRAANNRGADITYYVILRQLESECGGGGAPHRATLLIETRLDEFGDILGLSFGAWGEASRDVHVLIQALADSRLAFTGMQRGRPGSKAELGMITGQIRRRISLVAVNAQVECLLSKLHQVGPGNQQMAKNRQWALKEDERMSRER